jgi:hypothetical protein
MVNIVHTQIHIGMYLKLFLLLHADDTVMLAESAEELQLPLNIFQKVLLKMEALYRY